MIRWAFKWPKWPWLDIDRAEGYMLFGVALVFVGLAMFNVAAAFIVAGLFFVLIYYNAMSKIGAVKVKSDGTNKPN